MKIILGSPIYPPEIGGPATYAKEVSKRLADNHKITVIAYTLKENSDQDSNLIKIDKSKSLPIRLWDFFIATFKEASDADTLYAQNAMAAGLPMVLVGLLKRKPVIIKFVGDEAWERASQAGLTDALLPEFHTQPISSFKIRLLKRLQGWVLRRATIVTTPSQYLGKLITEVYSLKPERVKTNYNATKTIAPADTFENKKRHQLVTTARLVKWKGVDGIIDALAILKQKYPDVSLIVHGDGPCRSELEKLAVTVGVSDRITFTGNVDRSKTWRTRKESELYILNSTYEGLPHTALTSFDAEIPIIATDIAGTNEAVYHEKSGLLIPPNNPSALADAVSRLFEDTELQKKLTAGGSKILTEKFSWESHLHTLNLFFESVVTKPTN